MFTVSVLIGLYSYSILCLGLLSQLTRLNIVLVSAPFLIFILYFLLRIFPLKPFGQLNKLGLLSVLLLGITVMINLLGVFAPETGFDALWYHLTLPKIWLDNQSIFFIPGSIHKYSLMPMLTEMLYLPGLALGQVWLPKLVHFIFGLLTLWVTYQTARLIKNASAAWLACLILAGNLVFAWQSSSAYIDLARAFFEALAFYLFLQKQYFRSAVSLGWAVCAKLLSLGSLAIYLPLLIISEKNFKKAALFILVVVAVASPWFIRAWLASGNPVYPLFSPHYPDTAVSPNPLRIWQLFANSPDPLSPFFLISAPFLLIYQRRLWGGGGKFVLLYCLLALAVWFLTPDTGGGRFILPYLPVFSVLSALAITAVNQAWTRRLLIAVVVLISLITSAYRLVANIRYLADPGYLCARLNFNFGDFADCSGTYSRVLNRNDRVLVMGIHNQYYIPAKIVFAGYDYLLIREPDALLPPELSTWTEVVTDPATNTRLFKRP